ncbi:hypothetical protein EYF80_060869 [Liparis tanakae]|uniref:Secreted protein n=1 Tax=Liparis tanakae TaxID=230148 RepID=A0A4Z2EJI7_9TELE|nr:hypothetical protein EYF80_060869 [Liparis tanakae]
MSRTPMKECCVMLVMSALLTCATIQLNSLARGSVFTYVSVAVFSFRWHSHWDMSWRGAAVDPLPVFLFSPPAVSLPDFTLPFLSSPPV